MKAGEFQNFEHAFWSKTSNPYDAGIGAVTAKVIAPLLSCLHLKPGQSLLDVACGPGYMTRVAEASDVKVTGIDFSPAMIALAQQYFSHAAFKVADAQELPFKDNSFDAASCNFGVLHFADPDRAMREAFRVVRPDGRYAFTVWNALEKSLALAFMTEAVKIHGDGTPDLPEGPPFFYFADEVVAADALKKAGFVNIRRSVLDITWPMDLAESFVRIFHDGGARLGAILRAQSKDALGRITADIENRLKPYKSKNMYEVPVSVVINVAEKPL